MKAFGDDGLFQSAHSVTIDAQGALWVTDSAAHVVHKVRPRRRLLLSLGKKGVAGRQHVARICSTSPTTSPLPPTATSSVRWVCECTRRAFSGDGRFIRHRRRKGLPAGQLQLPHGVALDSKGAPRQRQRQPRVSSSTRWGRSWRRGRIPRAAGGIRRSRRRHGYISDVNAGIVNVVKRELDRQRVSGSGAWDGDRRRRLDLRVRGVADDGHEDHQGSVTPRRSLGA